MQYFVKNANHPVDVCQDTEPEVEMEPANKTSHHTKDLIKNGSNRTNAKVVIPQTSNIIRLDKGLLPRPLPQKALMRSLSQRKTRFLRNTKSTKIVAVKFQPQLETLKENEVCQAKELKPWKLLANVYIGYKKFLYVKKFDNLFDLKHEVFLLANKQHADYPQGIADKLWILNAEDEISESFSYIGNKLINDKVEQESSCCYYGF